MTALRIVLDGADRCQIVPLVLSFCFLALTCLLAVSMAWALALSIRDYLAQRRRRT
jgi:hypothetical protein